MNDVRQSVFLSKSRQANGLKAIATLGNSGSLHTDLVRVIGFLDDSNWWAARVSIPAPWD